MLYLIGGPSRAGKTQIARRLLAERGVPCFCIDYLVSALTSGAPQVGVNHDQPNRLRAETLWPMLRPMLANIVEEEPQYVVEGDTLLPHFVREFISTYPEDVRTCFVGYAAISPEQKFQNVRAFGGGVNDWVQGYSDRYVLDLVTGGIEYSRYLQEKCRKHGLPYFDTSSDFLETVDRAFQSLVSRQ